MNLVVAAQLYVWSGQGTGCFVWWRCNSCFTSLLALGTVFVALCLFLVSNQDFLAFSIYDVSALFPYIYLCQYGPLILPSIFSVFLHAMAY